MRNIGREFIAGSWIEAQARIINLQLKKKQGEEKQEEQIKKKEKEKPLVTFFMSLL